MSIAGPWTLQWTCDYLNQCCSTEEPVVVEQQISKTSFPVHWTNMNNLPPALCVAHWLAGIFAFSRVQLWSFQLHYLFCFVALILCFFFSSCPAVREMIVHPYETQSDSFYFVDNKLVMHNKADYSYSGGPWSCCRRKKPTTEHWKQSPFP